MIWSKTKLVCSFELHELYTFERRYFVWFWRVLRRTVYSLPLLWRQLAVIFLNKLIILIIKLTSNLKVCLSIITWRFIQLHYLPFLIYFFSTCVVRRVDGHIRVMDFKQRSRFLSKVRNVVGVSFHLLLLNLVRHDVIQVERIVIHHTDLLRLLLYISVVLLSSSV